MHAKNLFYFLILVLCLTPIVSQATSNTTPITTNINRILTEFGEDINIGIMVQNLQNSAVIYQKNPTRYFAPASNQKLLTAYAALSYLGSTFRYQTQLVLEPKNINGGIYHGDVYLRFSGDPLLTTADLDTLLSKLHDAGVTTIAGHLFIDDTAFDQALWPPGSSWDKQHACSGAPISALIIDHNCINNEPLQKPRMHMQNVLTNLSAKNHIQVSQGINLGRVPNKANAWLIHYSQPLSQLTTQMLKNGDNVIANSLFKILGGHYVHGQGNWKNGSKALQAILSTNLKTRFLDAALRDGAGASHYTQITPLQLSTLLVKGYQQPYFVNALPIAGVDGTLATRMINAKTMARVRAKTADENSISALSGYIQKIDQQNILAFVIIINGFVGSSIKYQELQDKICLVLADN
ncbi:hypothetical protein BH10PSE19_BH10PSE19_17720 [soil metagenome]